MQAAAKPKRRRNRHGDKTETATLRRRRNRNGVETETAKRSRWRRNQSGGEIQTTTQRAATRSTVTKPKRRRRRHTLAIIFNLKFGSNGHHFRAQIWNHFPSSNLEPVSVPKVESISVPEFGSMCKSYITWTIFLSLNLDPISKLIQKTCQDLTPEMGSRIEHGNDSHGNQF